MNKKGMELTFEKIAVAMLAIAVGLAILFIFNTTFRSGFMQIVGIREAVSNIDLPDLGSTVPGQKEPTVEKEPACKSFFDSLQSAVDLNKLSELSEGQLYYAINGHESFLEMNKEDSDCPREYITQIEGNLVKLRAEKAKRSPTA